MTKHYFAADGNYGDAHELVVVDTTDWSADDWADIESATDSNRLLVALTFSERAHSE